MLHAKIKTKTRKKTVQTMQQERAKFALEGVESASKLLMPEQKKEYRSHVAGLPFMIHANGLGQTAAFFRSKGTEKADYQLLYQLLSDWLKKEGQPFHGQNGLLEGITNSDMHTYLAAQAEAMVFMNWVRKFADAFMQEEKP
ncbi:MAG: type III-B CRISPR module-associated protein Cmr5 [Pseudomonadota bacterium]